ncbi:uncharacterized protein BX663DRAFT_507108 [Cokeromyces recurvatus]|uniref:uncharacterized protein n=1 Tax=Cokeromyces recurvatus TaxID=90255 RepID=UPI00221F89FD|nr:uncharacterized protein BX663DRAFT_507108 [Cokeromyces recurvatus]KAI7903620.1 hypothetical protein BX663DRAFT_507108 [Cokeromyces recurvatus]
MVSKIRYPDTTLVITSHNIFGVSLLEQLLFASSTKYFLYLFACLYSFFFLTIYFNS